MGSCGRYVDTWDRFCTEKQQLELLKPFLSQSPKALINELTSLQTEHKTKAVFSASTALLHL